MCSSPHWLVGLSWFREKLSPANREQRLSRWADFAKNCLPRIGSKELPRFREKYRALGRQKMGSYMRPWYIQFRDIRDRDISGLHCISASSLSSWWLNSCQLHVIRTQENIQLRNFNQSSTSFSVFNSLWPIDAVWHYRSGSTLAQVMVCCLTAPSHYLNQCWLVISKVQWQSSEGDSTRDTSAINN